MGWSGVKNGALLARAADDGFDVFVTKDTNLEYQQNLGKAMVGILVLVAHSHDLDVIAPLVPAALEVIPTITPGQVVHVIA